jgi:transitional endoplasmic reticulum ATPase
MTRVFASTTRVERLLALAIVVGYVVLALALWSGKDFSNEGPLSHRQPAADDEAFLSAGTNRERVLNDCSRVGLNRSHQVKVVSATIEGRALFACYDEGSRGNVNAAFAVDTNGAEITDPAVLKPAGVWPYYALIKTVPDFVAVGVGVVVLMGFGYFVATRARGMPAPPDAPWWGSGGVLGLLAATLFGWAVIPFLPRVPKSRKARFIMWGVVGWGVVLLVVLFTEVVSRHDTWGIAVTLYLCFAIAAAGIAGIRDRNRLRVNQAVDWAAPTPVGAGTVLMNAGASGPSGQGATRTTAAAADLARIEAPESLPNFRAVGGMDPLKKELADTLGLALAFSDAADVYKISWNGILLHGPPGVGKSYLAAATAGEFGLNLVRVSAGDLVSSYRGESARNVDAVFAVAAAHLPALLFFDEFDSIAIRRDDNPDQEARRTVNALLQALERTRKIRELIVMAATNDIGSLDPAVIRAGRFDRHIHVALPDLEARKAIFAAQLEGRPGAGAIDLDEVARRTEGMSPAVLAQVVSAASMQAMRDTSQDPNGALVPLTTERLVAALRARGGQDRPTVENWGWDRLVLPERTLAELKEITALLANPDRADAFGVEPPQGVLLYGPPGTGKTTIARVLAAQSNCSFYAQSAADLTSKWLGESERLVKQLFDRARENRPSIIFIDEIDAIASIRGEYGSYDRQVNQLLQEIDGMSASSGVLVVGATNRRDKIDPALLRGGRLSRLIEIPLPDVVARRRLLGLFTGGMPLATVDLDALARRTNGLAGADIEALCQAAAMQALLRGADAKPAITAADFDRALEDLGAPATRTPIDETGSGKGRHGDQGYA